jgi:hypothetical protein
MTSFRKPVVTGKLSMPEHNATPKREIRVLITRQAWDSALRPLLVQTDGFAVGPIQWRQQHRDHRRHRTIGQPARLSHGRVGRVALTVDRSGRPAVGQPGRDAWPHGTGCRTAQGSGGGQAIAGVPATTSSVDRQKCCRRCRDVVGSGSIGWATVVRRRTGGRRTQPVKQWMDRRGGISSGRSVRRQSVIPVVRRLEIEQYARSFFAVNNSVEQSYEPVFPL